MLDASFKLPSFAKINLLLRVLGKRTDGYHELCTVFQTVSLCDYLTFAEGKKITLTCDDCKIPLDDKNLIIRAAKILRENYGVKSGAKIHLEKRIPSPGGLGGGSSNAAVALIGLLKLWKLKIELEDLCELGATLGADVPFFFFGGTALGSGRGTEIFQLKDYAAEHLLIVTPNVAVSTEKAFKGLNAPDLTNKFSKSILQICRYEANSLYLRQSQLTNDFERTVFEIEPETARTKDKLFALGAKRALMSGSGASIAAVFASGDKKQSALDALQSETNWRVFSVETISRLDYRNRLGLDGVLRV
ncbi:MAG: 4-(cytidine 5'-diphospho)-2-C-methyl-D-erythritol kinase [Pyrinomonadaceae bacterium]